MAKTKELAPHVATIIERVAGLAHLLDKGNPIEAPLHDRVMLFLVTQNPEALPFGMRSKTPDQLNAVLSDEQREVVRHVRHRRNPGGRPKSLAELLRTKTLMVRLSDAEASEIRRRADDVHSSRASFMRRAALGDLPVRVPPLNLDTARALAGAAANLNQAMHALNSAALKHGEDLAPYFAEVREKCYLLALHMQGVDLVDADAPANDEREAA
ncbi:plasmid mobilization protein [Burkholderia cenocepacia]|uniref:plasmid mobilization protein n=1 Tax=Burkholderia cenocepacia TaxID=95486 RepID=UPI002AB79677|nr:hypothetical protein [Burkholderia cenocepacia]